MVAKITNADRKFWSFRPLQKVDLPVVKQANWARTPIDRFILAKLEAKGIKPNPPTSRRKLIRRAYFDASPLSYATVDKNRTRFLLVHGTADDIVDMATQTEAFLKALKQAGFFVRTIVLPGAGHFWVADPVEEAGSNGAQVAPRLLRFLEGAL